MRLLKNRLRLAPALGASLRSHETKRRSAHMNPSAALPPSHPGRKQPTEHIQQNERGGKVKEVNRYRDECVRAFHRPPRVRLGVGCAGLNTSSTRARPAS